MSTQPAPETQAVWSDACAGAEADIVADAVDRIEALVSAGGPQTDGEFGGLLQRLSGAERAGRLGAAGLRIVREAFGDALSPATMQGLAPAKRFGYSGDFEMLDAIYMSRLSSHDHLIGWDVYFHAQAAAQAVRNRKEYAKALLHALDEHQPAGPDIKVLNIACGPGRDICEYFDESPGSRIRVECLDFDRQALDYARHLCSAHLDRVAFSRGRLERFRSGSRFALIWCAGLFSAISFVGCSKLASYSTTSTATTQTDVS